MSTSHTGRKFLFVASTGGHLAQLVRLSSRFDASEDSLWITFRSPQSESLLEGRRVLFVPYIRPRAFIKTAQTVSVVRSLLKRESFDEAISTGAALAVSVLPLAKLRGIKTTYIESVSRVNGPSLSGRILRALHSADLYTQHAQWADSRWKHIEGVLSEFETIPKDTVSVPRLFVTLGTIERYRFDSLIDAVLDSGLADDSTTWQLGVTTRNDLPGEVHNLMSATEFDEAAQGADVVITHAGVGTILQLLEMGISPIIVPRRKSRDEHVDDHQDQIASLLRRLGVGSVQLMESLSRESIVSSTGNSVRAVARGSIQ
ncbi:glycosyltransferase [Subtercola boreus]|uniref:Glycosyl transferase family 28 C-terminal domain-containing protein n=1 Tax=Subtercola boreus TaxID=120213 RepID=A0A3E0WEI1_9MICO|nr:glycosyltransferase [Subtercola boreus]RFA22531.1 hypothetical protein B7R24_02590 [Subtercola boreus]RFA22887.1 hypothetical protein B7R23_02585 [Subtercola boreus]RFA28639.1 hypothetical protein B7R25_02600 [Subtercola boreus]